MGDNFTDYASGIPLIGGVFSAIGAKQANDKNKRQKERLERQGNRLLNLASPYSMALSSGYAPGGALRQAEEGVGRMGVMDAYNKGVGALRSGSWRYGGTGSGLAGARWKEAQIARDEGLADAAMKADLTSEDILSRMEATRLGYKNAMSPVTVYENRMAWLGPALNQFAQGYSDTGEY